MAFLVFGTRNNIRREDDHAVKEAIGTVTAEVF